MVAIQLFILRKLEDGDLTEKQLRQNIRADKLISQYTKGDMFKSAYFYLAEKNHIEPVEITFDKEHNMYFRITVISYQCFKTKELQDLYN